MQTIISLANGLVISSGIFEGPGTLFGDVQVVSSGEIRPGNGVSCNSFWVLCTIQGVLLQDSEEVPFMFVCWFGGPVQLFLAGNFSMLGSSTRMGVFFGQQFASFFEISGQAQFGGRMEVVVDATIGLLPANQS